MTEQEVRAALNRWSDAKLLRPKRLGDQISITSLTEVATYVVRLRTLHEERSVSRKREVYRGDRLDDSGAPPNPADIGVAPPEEFEEQTIELRVAHTDRVEKCGPCSGNGKIRCPFCQGSGRRVCGSCGGSGRKMRSEQRPVFQGGRTTYQSQMVSVPCGSCSGGRVTCSCMGGWQRCSSCGATGRLKTYDSLQVQFRPSVVTRSINVTGLPDDLLLKTPGRIVFEDAPSALSGKNDIPSETSSVTGAMLAEAKKDQGRIVRQQLRVDVVTVTHVAFTTPKSGAGRAWIYGPDQAVHAPDVHAPGLAGRIGKWFS